MAHAIVTPEDLALPQKRWNAEYACSERLVGIRLETSLGSWRGDTGREINAVERGGPERIFEYRLLGERASLTPATVGQLESELKGVWMILIEAHCSQRHERVEGVCRGADQGHSELVGCADDVACRVLTLACLLGWPHQAGSIEDRAIQNRPYLPIDSVTLTKRLRLRKREVRVRGYEVEVQPDDVSWHAKFSRSRSGT
jgi:hypothetical protein